MISLLIGLLGALITSNNLPANAVSHSVATTNAAVVHEASTNDAVEMEYRQLLEDDDAAQTEVNGWIKENQKFAAKGAGESNAELNARIRKRLGVVRKEYEEFIKRHPNYVKARIAYASFLEDLGDEHGEMRQLEKARQLDPKDPAIWNNLANYYGHNSPVKKAFAYYAKAIELDPTEPVYYENLATTVYLFRKDAKEYYHINEQQVFDKALALYAKALQLDPTNFALATELAMSYYGIRPMRTDAALQAWTNALNIAQTEIEREGVYIHFARIERMAGRLAQARARLDAVTNPMYADLKRIQLRDLREKEQEAMETNSPPATTNKQARVPHAGKDGTNRIHTSANPKD